MIHKIEIAQHSKYECAFCGKTAVRRQAVGIWECKHCSVKMAGGAYTLSTSAANQVRVTLQRVKRIAAAAAATVVAAPAAKA